MQKTIRVYCLVDFDEDEESEILTQLEDDSYQSSSTSDVRIELIPWDAEEDGDREDIADIHFENRKSGNDFTFFVDRKSYRKQDFIIVDSRAAQSPWFIEQVLQHYGHSFSMTWSEDIELRNIVSGSSVPYGRCDDYQSWVAGIKRIYRKFAAHQTTFDQVVEKGSIHYAYTHDERTLRALAQCVHRLQQEFTRHQQVSDGAEQYPQTSQVAPSSQDLQRQWSMSGNEYAEKTPSYQTGTAGAEYRLEKQLSRGSVSNAEYEDNTYHSYQAEIAEAEFCDEQKHGYVQDGQRGLARRDEDYSTNEFNTRVHSDRARSISLQHASDGVAGPGRPRETDEENDHLSNQVVMYDRKQNAQEQHGVD